MKPEIRISVRELAEYACEGGDLIGARASLRRALDGAAAHRRLQQAQPSGYIKELPLSVKAEREEYILVIEGRADGVLPDIPQIHEIKTTYLPLEELTWNHNPAYHAQLWIYGYIYASDNSLEQVSLRLTYYNMQSGKSRDFTCCVDFEELRARFNELVDDYGRISDNISLHRRLRDNALARLEFPFTSYRPSQLEFARQVYMAIKNKNTLYVQAPTGTGKTAAALFPALKALGAGLCKRIFYLTAKAQTGMSAVNTLDIIRKSGLPLKSVFITAKDKACLMEKRVCDPEACPYCRDYLTKQHRHLPAILRENTFSPEYIASLGQRYELCPFELSLTLSQYCDCIICDYNYVFHPNIRLKRYFQNSKKDSVFLIDEAHNLVERTRDIFSCTLRPSVLKKLRAECKEQPLLQSSVKKLEKELMRLTEGHEEQGFLLEQPPACVYGAAAAVLERINAQSEQGDPLSPAASELSLLLSDFLMVFDSFTPQYHSCYVLNDGAMSLSLLCLYTGGFVRKALDLARSSVLFSATISPRRYYMHMLGADENSYCFELPSPFDSDNLLVVIDDGINTAYSAREDAYTPIAKRIRTTVRAKKGNYIAFFPSYAFLNRVLTAYRGLAGCQESSLVVHTPNMSKQERDAFIYRFEHEDGLLGFSVLGGHFGEGVDLPGKRLIGAIIIGVGLPQLSPERNLIKSYFDRLDMDGYGYAYVFPGLNRVLQAAGRVIRTENDRGVVLLIDTRYARPPYIDLLPDNWQPHYLSQEELSYRNLLADFWEQ